MKCPVYLDGRTVLRDVPYCVPYSAVGLQTATREQFNFLDSAGCMPCFGLHVCWPCTKRYRMHKHVCLNATWDRILAVQCQFQAKGELSNLRPASLQTGKTFLRGLLRGTFSLRVPASCSVLSGLHSRSLVIFRTSTSTKRN